MLQWTEREKYDEVKRSAEDLAKEGIPTFLTEEDESRNCQVLVFPSIASGAEQ